MKNQVTAIETDNSENSGNQIIFTDIKAQHLKKRFSTIHFSLGGNNF